MIIFLLCLKIFFARIVDVCLGTFRTICIVKGKREASAIIAFIEVFVWFMIAREALNTEVSSIFIPLAYAGGFATGTYLGLVLSNHIIGGTLTIHVISPMINQNHIKMLKKNGYGVSSFNTQDHKTMLIIEIDKKNLNELNTLIHEIDKNAFMIVDESKYVFNGFIK